MRFKTIDDFEKIFDSLEEKLGVSTMKSVIEGFENKGWALYEADKEISNEHGLEKVIQSRYENQLLKPNKRYVPLPHVKGHEGDYQKVMRAVSNLKNPPAFVEFDEKSIPDEYKDMPTPRLLTYGVFPNVKGVYPIDSIEFNGELALVIDKRGMPEEYNSRIPENTQEPAIIIGHSEIPDTLKFQVNRYKSIESGELKAAEEYLAQ
ncbi:MAG: hypothetical protein ACOCQG_04910 [Candidatus Nanoarchaeia archaeon]